MVIASSISADWSDWFTPKTIVVGLYTASCVYGVKKWVMPYVFFKSAAAKEYTYRFEVRHEGLKSDIKPATIKITDPLLQSYGNADIDLSLQANSVSQQKKVGMYGIQLSLNYYATYTSHRYPMLVTATISTQQIETDGRLKKVGYAYGVAGLGVLAFCGLSK
jgi:hypothetical protein